MLDVSALANRLAKNWKHYGKWARRQGIEAWRVYDRDIPQFPLAIDIYGEHCHIQEYETGWVQEEAEHDGWLVAVKACIESVTGIPVDRMGVKTRRRQKGENQYQKQERQGEDFVVEEFGLRFWVNMEAYLDTGLFLDHRNTRRQVMSEAAGKRVLNLFAYTGSFTVYAAAGGAVSSETVDLSNTYQQWTRRNFELNGIDSRAHTLVRDDVFHYLSDAVATGKRFDLIVMDPPTFSNSKRMDDILDVQRDHVWLIEQAMELLAENGVLYFSTNLRSFQLDEKLPVLYGVDDISRQSVPDDFRNKKIHRCYRLRNHS
jgi:23S rRNA (cytosine1962-C5)-methyltransferase